MRHDMLSVCSDDLRRAADIIDAALSDFSITVVGGQEHLDTLDADKMTIIRI